jgi:hypothetical protein
MNCLKGKKVTCFRYIVEEDPLYVDVGVFGLFNGLQMGKVWEVVLRG